MPLGGNQEAWIPAVFDRRKILFNGIGAWGIREQKEQRGEGRVINSGVLAVLGNGALSIEEGRRGRQLFEEMLFQAGMGPLRMSTPYQQHGCDEPLHRIDSDHAVASSGDRFDGGRLGFVQNSHNLLF